MHHGDLNPWRVRKCRTVQPWFAPSYQVSVDNSDSEFICVNYVDDASFLCPIPGCRRIDG